MRYSNYQTHDFLQDEAFIKWVREPDEESTAFWEGWLQNNPLQTATVAKAKELVLILDFPEVVDTATEEECQEVFEKVLAADRYNPVNISSSETKPQWIKTFRKLAAIMMIPILGFIYWSFLEDVENETPLKAEMSWITKVSPKGRKVSLRLSDGTTVKLNSGSSLRFPSYFSDTVREVHLVGEGFFEVNHDTTRPFNVYTNQLKIEVLGTSFNVKAYGNNNVQKVSLLKGKVALALKEDRTNTFPVILKPMEAGMYSEKNHLLNKEIFNTKEDISWVDGVLYFHKATFDEVVQRLELWYGVEIKILKTPERITGLIGEFNNTSINKVLETLSHTSGFKYEIKDKTVIIK